MDVKIKLLHEKAVIPTKAHNDDAGFDLTAVARTVDNYGNYVYDTGVAMNIPSGYVGLIFQRSSVAKKSVILSNSVGVIDAGYTGSITFKYKPIVADVSSSMARPYEVGERIGQIIIIPIPRINCTG